MTEALGSLDPIALVTVIAAFLGAVASLWSVRVSHRKGLKDSDIADAQISLEQLTLVHSVKDTLLTQVLAENNRLLEENDRLRKQRDELEAKSNEANQPQ